MGRSSSRQRVGTKGYRPRTRKDPPGGGVKRRSVAAASAGSSETDGLAEAVEGEVVAGEDMAARDGAPDIEVDPSSRGVTVHADISPTRIATVARARDQ
jgi:hypothetical protein